MDLNEYQRRALATRRRPNKTEERDPIIALLGIAGEAGQLLSEYKKYLRDGDAYTPFRERVGEELGDILWYLASAADEFGLPLEGVAEANLEKCVRRFGGESGDPIPRFDEAYPESERLPRRLNVLLRSDNGPDGNKLRMFLEDGSPVGDYLTDNAYEEDGYRFHDVFHLTCLATLGWSPVMRKLLGRRRLSDPRVGEVEDGGRATVIEEGITALVFSYALDRRQLSGIAAIDYELLRTIEGMTRHLEVSACSARHWENTILRAFEVWREAYHRKGGTLSLDLDARAISLGVGRLGAG